MNNMYMCDEVLTKYKNYLLDLDYPFIKEKADNEIKNIFEAEYREYLLSWIITKLIPIYSNKLEESKKNNKLEQVLASIIYENGFCRASEKDSFVKGNLDVNAQIIIFDRIFNMLSLIYTNNVPHEESKENMSENQNTLKQIFMKPSKENFKSDILHDTTLIPTLGISSKMTLNEKKDKIKFYQEEIERLQEMLEMAQLDEEELNSSKNNTDYFSITEKLTSKFIDYTNQFKTDDLITVSGNDEDGSSKKLVLEDCVQNNADILNIINKTIQKKCDLNAVMNEKLIDEDLDLSNANDYFACVLQSYAMSDNILQEINRNTED